MIKAGFIIKIVGIFADGFNESFLGRTIDQETFSKLQQIQKEKKINIAGEGGEYETLVVDGPIFQKRIVLIDTEKQWKRDHGTLLVKDARLEEKE